MSDKTQSIDIGNAPENPQKPPESSGSRGATGLDGLDPSRRSAVLRRAAQVPESARTLYLRAVLGQASPRQAIKSHCLECACCDRAAIAECSGLACPLWTYRPFQPDGDRETGAGV